jgi:membrane associated rhomboid family serine protease
LLEVLESRDIGLLALCFVALCVNASLFRFVLAALEFAFTLSSLLPSRLAFVHHDHFLPS